MKRTIKPIEGEYLDSYWKHCEGSFAGDWYKKAIKYAEKNGGVHYMDKWTSKIALNK